MSAQFPYIKPGDENPALSIDLDSFLDTVDLDAAVAAAEEKAKGGGEVLQPSNTCESGACAI